jgi:hypothetical protein
MEESEDIAQLKQIAEDAMKMLEGVRRNFGLFQNQRYWKLKAKLDNYNRLSNALKVELSYIKTIE